RQRVTEALASVPIISDGHASLAFDATSNRINTAGWEYDKAGNQTRTQVSAGGAWQRYQYDAANRLAKVKTDAGTVIASYTYGDTKDRLMVDESGTRTYYMCEGDAEYVESGASTSPVWSRSYIYLGMRLLSQLTPNGSGGELVNYYHPDSLGTRMVTNAQDTSSFEQVSLPFGVALNSESTGPPINRRFGGYDRSSTTGLDNAVNRHYDSQQGRFTQVDPIGIAGVDLASPQTLNLYTYCGNDPINQSDADGLFFGKLLKWFRKALKILGIVSLIVVTILFTGIPVPLWLFKAAAWVFFKVLLPVASFLSRVPFLGGVIRTGPVGSPQWNPNSGSIFGNSFQDGAGKCPPDCQDQITLPPVSAGTIYANYSVWERLWGGTKTVGRTVWSGYKIAATFFSGYDEEVVPAVRHIRHFGEWVTGIRVVDEDSWLYSAGGWTQIAAQTVLTAGLVTEERVAIEATDSIRTRFFRWGWSRFGKNVERKLHFHLGPDPGLMKHHLPYDWKIWYYHARSRLIRWWGR
ncbi:MAG TPA: RHS repeat-associated core domain-containing protein, partial [Pyrinomonadaceae bacterium]|nr:RHS repeat-associated core domain-containing protein [Pyrinomonadaceae bacterium]